MKSWLRSWIPLFVVWLVVGAVFGRVVNNGFVWDDGEQIVNNRTIRSWSGVADFFKGQSTFDDGGAVGQKHIYYKPLLGVWWIVNFQIFGGVEAWGFHLLQLGLHLANVGLVWLLVRKVNSQTKFKIQNSKLKTTDNNLKQSGSNQALGIEFWVALVWGVHAANTEAVVYASAVQELLFSFFGLGGLWWLVRGKVWEENLGRKWYWVLAGGWFGAAAFAKETGLLPVLIGWWWTRCFWRERGGTMKRLVGLVWGGYGLMRLGVAGVGFLHRLEAVPIQRVDVWKRGLTVIYALSQHIRVMVWPVVLRVSDHTVVDRVSVDWWLKLAVVVVFGIWIGKKLRLKMRIEKWLAVWWLVSIVLVSNVLALDMTFAERWVYWPMVAVVWLVVLEVTSWRWGKWLLLLVIVAMGIRVNLRLPEWKNDLSLARADANKGQGAYDMANNLGWELYRLGQREEGKRWLEKSIDMNPQWWVAYNNLGVYYHERGGWEQAEKMYLTSIEKGNYVLAWANLVKLYGIQGDGRWMGVLERALADYPNNQELRILLENEE